MFGPNFSDYYREALEKIKREILHESDTQILGSEIEELVNYYHQKFALVSVGFEPTEISYEIKKEVRMVPAYQREEPWSNEGDIEWEYETATITLPIQESPNLDWIRQLNNSWSSDGFEKNISYRAHEISYSFDTKWYGSSLDENATAIKINTESNRLIGVITEKNNCIRLENNKFTQAIRDCVSQRKEQLFSDKEKLNSLAKKVNIAIKQKIPTTATKVSIDTKKFVQLIKPTPRLPKEYTIEKKILEEILNYVDNQCKSFEKTPASYKQLGEEQLRDIILSALNGIFEGDATGETFVKNGKTDIHLKIEKGEILIFECKLWGGEKIYLETIDQLIGYVTWRQNYGVVIMFCKNKDFSKILLQIPEIIQKHPQYVGKYRMINNSHFVSSHTLPEEDGYKCINSYNH